jgi:hypothetical protein
VFAIVLFIIVSILLVKMIQGSEKRVLRRHAKCEWRLALVINVAIGAIALAEQNAGKRDLSSITDGFKHDLERALRGPQTPDEIAELDRFNDGID